MSKLLHISASPRGEKSKSRALALAHIAKRLTADPALPVDLRSRIDTTLKQG